MRFLLDENIPLAVLRQLQRKFPELDVVRVVDAGLMGEPDDVVLAFAAQENRILLSRDKATLTEFAFERIKSRSWHAWSYCHDPSVISRTYS